MVKMRFVLVGLQLVLFQLVAAQTVCNVDDNAFSQGRVIGSQQDFNTFLGNCTSITGFLTIGPNYQGSLNISGVTSIDELTHIAPPLGLTDILLSDVEYMKNLKFINTPVLRQVSAPNLKMVGKVELVPIAALYLDLPSLETIEDEIKMEGRMELFNVPLLSNASSIDIYNKLPTGSLDKILRIEFPALDQIRRLRLYGNGFASVSMPKLRIAKDKLYIQVSPVLDLNFPSLKSTNATEIVTYGSPDFSSLTHAQGVFQINLYDAVAVTLPLLTYAEDVRIMGKPLNVILPKLSAIWTAYILNSFTPSAPYNGVLDCANANAAFRRVQETWPNKVNPDCWGVSGCSRIICRQEKDTMKKSTTIGMGVGIGAGVFVIAIIIICWWKRKRREEKQQRAAVSLELENRDRIASSNLHAGRRRDSGDSLPPYVAEDQNDGVLRPLPKYTRENVPLAPTPSTNTATRSASTGGVRRESDASWLGPVIGSRSVVH